MPGSYPVARSSFRVFGGPVVLCGCNPVRVWAIFLPETAQDWQTDRVTQRLLSAGPSRQTKKEINVLAMKNMKNK